MSRIKAHCEKYDKWFVLELENQNGQDRIVNFVNLSGKAAEGINTELEGNSFRVSSSLRFCVKCGSDKAGCCDHAERLGFCNSEYYYQCLFCNRLRINRKAASSRFTEWAGTNLIPGAETDRFGNAKGSKYDLAKDNGFKGFKVLILCLYTGEGILSGIQSPVAALRRKGFDVELISSASPDTLRRKLADVCQLWVISDKTRHLNDAHRKVIQDFYDCGHGVYIWGDNDPFYADANFLAEGLLGCSMSGNYEGKQIIGVSKSAGQPGILAGHPISTGIVNFYEGVTIATIRPGQSVKPLVWNSQCGIVTGIADAGRRRALVDGGFTRLYVDWNTAGTDRFVVNAAAWLANADGAVGGEESFR